MSGWELSDEHEMFRKVVREFAEAEIAPHAAQWDDDHHFPVDVVRAMGELGLFGLVFPEEWGGARRRLRLAVRGDRGARPGRPVDRHHAVGRRRARRQPDPPVRQRRAEATGGCPTSSPVARSARSASPSPTAAATPAPPAPGPGCDGDEWVIDGAKAFITNCGTPITSVITVTARTDDGISAFVVPAGTPGSVVEPPYRKLGWHASDTHGLTLDDCRVPADNLLGHAGAGVPQLPRRSSTTAGSRSRRSRSVARGRASSTRSSTPSSATPSAGRSAASRASPSSSPTSPSTVENAHNLTYKAAWLKDQGRPIGEAAAMAKLYSTEAAVDRDARRDAGARRRAASSRRRRSPGSTATPRSSRSARAPARSSGSCWPAASACRWADRGSSLSGC